MTKNSQSHLGDNRTSAFTLPSPRKQPQEQEQQQSPINCTATTPLHSNSASKADSYEEFPSNINNTHNRSPSLPWLMEYWSSSLCQAPEMVLDNLCSCASASEPIVVDDDMTTTIRANSSIRSSQSSYFDDTILRSDPKVDRSPTKISPTRWEALRSVVASHGDYNAQDYCDFYEQSLTTMPSIEETKENSSTSMNMMNPADSIYPTKNYVNNSQATRSILDDCKEDDEDEEDDDVNMMNAHDDDDIRTQPPLEHASSNLELHTCLSFDQSRFLCSDSPSTPRTLSTAPPLSPPTTRLPDRRRGRPASASQISPRTLGFTPNGNRLMPPSPAPSAADTYTTISLSQSFAREFEEDEDDEEIRLEGGNLFLDRLASETYSPSRSPFRRLKPRTTNNGHEDEKKEDTEDYNYSPSTPPRKRAACEDSEEEDVSAYRCLVRMSPDNYKHGKSVDEDWFEPQHYLPEESGSVTSNTSSVLLPLHPHQRIMAPLPHDSKMENSGYSCFREQVRRRTTY